jgi:hypothetical protein
MFRSDILFTIILVVLLVVPFCSVYPEFKMFPYALFFSALGAASIVILAWERIADRREVILRRLMKRVYLEKGGIELHQTLRAVCDIVRGCRELSGEESKKIQRAISTLERSGCFHHVDHLYPKEILWELETLSQWMKKYEQELDDLILTINEFEGGRFREYCDDVLRMMRGDAGMRLEGESYISYGKPDREPRKAWASFDRKTGQEFLTFVGTLEERSSFGRRIHDSTWKGEILQRASRIRDGFVSFLEKHGLEAPSGSDEDWVEGGVVVAYSGPIF